MTPLPVYGTSPRDEQGLQALPELPEEAHGSDELLQDMHPDAVAHFFGEGETTWAPVYLRGTWYKIRLDAS